MTLGSRVAVMRDGRLEQIGAPLELYRTPANAFVAGFIGTPAMNLWAGECLSGGAVRISGSQAPIDLHAALPQGPVLIGVRPQDLELVERDADLRGEIAVVEPLGASTIVHLRSAEMGDLVRIVVPASREVRAGQPAAARIDRQRVHLFDAEGRRRLG